jgi:hypothetical protein
VTAVVATSAGTAVIRYPAEGRFAVAIIFAPRTLAAISIESGAAPEPGTLSVRVTVLVPKNGPPKPDKVIATFTLLYTVIEEVLVVVVLVGIAVWLNVATAVTVSPFSGIGSAPLTTFKVAMTV